MARPSSKKASSSATTRTLSLLPPRPVHFRWKELKEHSDGLGRGLHLRMARFF